MVVLRFVLEAFGVLSAMTFGRMKMQVLRVDSLVSQSMVGCHALLEIIMI